MRMLERFCDHLYYRTCIPITKGRTLKSSVQKIHIPSRFHRPWKFLSSVETANTIRVPKQWIHLNRYRSYLEFQKGVDTIGNSFIAPQALLSSNPPPPRLACKHPHISDDFRMGRNWISARSSIRNSAIFFTCSCFSKELQRSKIRYSSIETTVKDKTMSFEPGLSISKSRSHEVPC